MLKITILLVFSLKKQEICSKYTTVLCCKKFYWIGPIFYFSTHSMTFSDQLFFANNVTGWKDRLPAIYHGHFAFIDLHKLSDDKTKNIVHINMIRKPLDR